MSSHDDNRVRNTSTVTTTQTQHETVTPDLDVLTPQEEKVLRMLHGLSEENKYELKFALGADEELQFRLAKMEKYLVELFQGEQLNDEILNELRTLQGELDPS